MRVARAPSNAFCSALKSGAPCASSTTISPSSQRRAEAQRARARGDARRSLRGPVVAVAREQAHVAAVDAGEHAVAVELDLVASSRRRRAALRPASRAAGCELRRAAPACGAASLVGRRGVRHGDRRFAARRPVFARRARWPGAWPRRLRRSAPVDSTLSGTRLDDAVLGGRPREVVALLDQQPRLLAFVVAPVHAHQRPAAVQLLAVQLELELAGAIALRADRPPAPRCRGPRR